MQDYSAFSIMEKKIIEVTGSTVLIKQPVTLDIASKNLLRNPRNDSWNMNVGSKLLVK